MKQFTFDIQEKKVTEDYIELKLSTSSLERQDLIDFFPTTDPRWYNLKLRNRADDIKITDKIIVSFDINQIDIEEDFLDKLDKLLYQAKYLDDTVAYNQKDRILSKIKYLANYHYSIESRKAPVAE